MLIMNGSDVYEDYDRKYDSDGKYAEADDDDVVLMQMILNYVCGKR